MNISDVLDCFSFSCIHCLFLLIKLGCPHCKKMKPEFSKAAKEINIDNTIDGALGAVDCTTARELCTKQGVKNYPTREYFLPPCHAQFTYISVLLSSHRERYLKLLLAMPNIKKNPHKSQTVSTFQFHEGKTFLRYQEIKGQTFNNNSNKYWWSP